jgi:hypothetical protein
MLPKRSDLPFWLSAVATALLMFVGPARRWAVGQLVAACG